MELKKLSVEESKGATIIGSQLELGTYKLTGLSAEEVLVIKKGTPAKGSTPAVPDQKFLLLELTGNCEKNGVSIGLQRISVPYVKGWAEATDTNATVTVEVYNVLNTDGTQKLSPSGYPVQRTRVVSVEEPA